MMQLADYLGVPDAEEEEELSNLEEVPGSCQWLLQLPSFIRWRDEVTEFGLPESERSARGRDPQNSARARATRSRTPRCFWLSGAAGTGKSVLAAHVIRHLAQDRDCSYYFLKHIDKSKQSLGTLLRSLAYQMANRDPSLRRSLLSMQHEEDLTADPNDVRAIWRQLFQKRIFRTESQQRHYWVIDAIDESHACHELFPLLAKIEDKFPLRIFLTSRRSVTLEKQFQKLPIISEQIQVANTLGDIRLLLRANIDSIHFSDQTAVDDLIDTLVIKSNGSFLWAYLILQQLDNSWSDKAIYEAMDQVPEEMDELYRHILDQMSMSGDSNKEIARVILRWTVCAIRPLTIQELQEAIRLDINHTVYRSDKMIEAVCGQLVQVDKQSKVQVVHDTVREFLLNKSLESEFAIDKDQTHADLAEICLRFLGDEDSKGAHVRRPLSASIMEKPLLEYASTNFSEHLVRSPRSPASVNILLPKLESFLATSVLAWIELVARERNLKPLTQTAKNLKRYADQRVELHYQSDDEFKDIRTWAVDLIHLVTVFGRHLVNQPSSIRHLIPALCPRESMLYRKFSNSALGLEVVGVSARTWADRISCTPFHEDYITALACCDKIYAVGLRSGTVVLYYVSTCQEARRFIHGEAVRHLEFATIHDWVTVSGKRTLTLWDFQSATQKWKIDTVHEPLALTFAEDDSLVIAATKGSHTESWYTKDGSASSNTSWYSNGNGSSRHIQPPKNVCISQELNLMAIVYRNQPVVLWNLLPPVRLGTLPKESDVTSLVFNPVRALNLLAIGCFDGEVTVLDLRNYQVKAHAEADASSLAASPDGKILIAGDNSGTIRIFDFETLEPLHLLRSEDEEITSMVFAGSSLRFLEIRRDRLNVWEPSALVRRRDNEDTSSSSEGQTSAFSSAPSQLALVHSLSEEPTITAMVSHHSGDFIFAGRDDGSVLIYSTRRGMAQHVLYSHGNNTPVTMLDWNAMRDLLVSSDSCGKVLVHKTRTIPPRTPTAPRTWSKQKLIDERIGDVVRQILLSLDGKFLLISTLNSDQLWTTTGKQVINHQIEDSGHIKALSQEWATNPNNKRQIFKISNLGIQVIDWTPTAEDTKSGAKSNFQPTINSVPLTPRYRNDPDIHAHGLHFVRFGDQEQWAIYDTNPFTCPLLWTDLSTTMMASANPSSYFAKASAMAETILGKFRAHLIFLDHEGWICSFRLDGGPARAHQRHFFIPPDWQSYNRGLISLITTKGDIAFAKGHEVAIIRGGLNF
jgi:WD40 repeat protein